MKRLAILGSTGSIGKNALAVVSGHPEEYAVVGLAAGKNLETLAAQISTYQPLRVSVAEAGLAQQLRSMLPMADGRLEILAGVSGAVTVATSPEVDMVVSAMVGAVGLEPTLAAIQAGKAIALANKETLVVAGPLVMAAAKKQGVSLIPVDSEHSAIFQAARGHNPGDIRRLLLTASGGPFRTWPKERLAKVTSAQALNHPTWNMGAKITIDSATMMNKALELIEASVLFGLPVDKIEVVIHPQSIIHSLVEFVDGSVLAQMGWPDMRVPIAYALSYPHRLSLNSEPLDLGRVAQLTFERPDFERFPALRLGYEAAQRGGTMPAVLNAANEEAVAAFLAGRLSFLGIPQIVAETMAAHETAPLQDLAQVLAVDDWARDYARQAMAARDNF